ncbi:MAG TPA: ATP-binding protein [Xanthomonadaceae bacterium]
MRLSIGHRLFLAVLLSIVVVATVGVELARWKLFDHSPDVSASVEVEQVARLSDALSVQYRQHHDWSFLPADSARRKAWLREELLRSQEGRRAQADVQRLSPTLGYRIGLLDEDRHYLAGAIASPAIVAFASIDRFVLHLVVDGKTVGYLIVATPQNPDDELAVAFLVDQQWNLLVVAAIGVLLSALAAALLAAHFRKPIGQLVEGARRLEDARFDTRLAIRRSDEIGELADTFNHLAARLEDTERSRRQWIADTSHELRTPLSVLRGQLEALQDGVRDATPENVAIMLRQVRALAKLVDDLHELARADIGQLQYDKTVVDAWRLVVDELEGFSGKFRDAGLVAIAGAPPDRSRVHCDADRIRQVVTNLIENCARYTAAGGRVEVHGVAVGRELRIAIEDSAPGVPEAALRRLGERFFRVETSRNRQLGGAGLGLALCRQILEAHDGRLEFGPSPLGGLRATVVLKLAS